MSGLLALYSALHHWKWWRRAPGEVEVALTARQLESVDQVMIDMAMDAIEEYNEESRFPIKVTEPLTLEAFYQIIIDIGEANPGFHGWDRDMTSREAILQQIEDLITGYAGLFDEISSLPLDEGRVHAMRGLIFDALSWAEDGREGPIPI